MEGGGVEGGGVEGGGVEWREVEWRKWSLVRESGQWVMDSR